MFSHQYNYAPSANTLSVDIRDEIENTFPTLHADVINDAVQFGTQQYTSVPDTASDQEAKDFFLNSVMNYILNHLKQQQYNIISALMLLRERKRHLSDTAQDFYSGIMSLQSRPAEMIADKFADIIADKIPDTFTGRSPPRFPKQYRYNVEGGYPDFLRRDPGRIKSFSTLRNKLKQQLIVTERFAHAWTPYDRDILIQIFDEVYNLQLIGLHSIQLERLIIDAVYLILRNNNNLSSKDKADFMFHFSSTINNEENIIYCKNKRKEF